MKVFQIHGSHNVNEKADDDKRAGGGGGVFKVKKNSI